MILLRRVAFTPETLPKGPSRVTWQWWEGSETGFLSYTLPSERAAASRMGLFGAFAALRKAVDARWPGFGFFAWAEPGVLEVYEGSGGWVPERRRPVLLPEDDIPDQDHLPLE